MNLEATALAAYALGLSSLGHPAVHGAIDHLLAHRSPHGAWSTTQVTIHALRAILSASGASRDGVATVKLTGGSPARHPIRAGSLTPVTVDLGASAQKGANLVELSSTVPISYQVVATYTLPWRDADADNERALRLQVSYGRTRVSVGDVVPITAKLTHRGQQATGMALLSLGIPAGLTPLTEDLEPLKASGKIAKAEAHATRIDLYLDSLGANTTEVLSIRFRAGRAVRTAGASSHAYLYYTPSVRDRVSPTPIEIR